MLTHRPKSAREPAAGAASPVGLRSSPHARPRLIDARPAAVRLAQLAHIANASRSAGRAGRSGIGLPDRLETNFPSRTIQRIIIKGPGGPAGPPFAFQGRAGPHNTAANRNALDALRLHRAGNANPLALHVNNGYETAAVAQGNDVRGLDLDMAHHFSDHVIQEQIVNAANRYNQSPQTVDWDAAWKLVNAMMYGIKLDTKAHPYDIPAFSTAADAAYKNALSALEAVKPGPSQPIPVTKRILIELTDLAHAIANSPMNLHHGNAGRNRSLATKSDPNSFPAVPPLVRLMTWRSWQMRASLLAAGFNPSDEDRTWDQANNMAGSRAHVDAAAFPVQPPTPNLMGPTGLTLIHHSASPHGF